MPVKLLHHMTCQINQKIYSYPKGGNLGNCPLFKEKGTKLCDGFIPDEAYYGALLKVTELFILTSTLSFVFMKLAIVKRCGVQLCGLTNTQ